MQLKLWNVIMLIMISISATSYAQSDCDVYEYTVCVPKGYDPVKVKFVFYSLLPGHHPKPGVSSFTALPMVKGAGGGSNIKGREVQEVLFYESLSDEEKLDFIKSGIGIIVNSPEKYEQVRQQLIKHNLLQDMQKQDLLKDLKGTQYDKERLQNINPNQYKQLEKLRGYDKTQVK